MLKTVLIVEDDDGLRTSVTRSFERQGYRVTSVGTVARAQEELGKRKIDLVLLDIRLPDGSGLEFLPQILEADEEIIVVMMTAFPDLKTAVRAMKAGAYDFILKPFELEELHLAIQRAVETQELRRNIWRLERENRTQAETKEILGESRAITEMRKQIQQVAMADIPLLITGETGTGKELVAESVHRLSARSKKPLIKVNCSAFPAQLLEGQLFGHEKGAFTDAKTAQPGLFEMADGGSLLLDEIGELHPTAQAKLLRVVEGHPFRRIGGRREIHADVRVIAATNRNVVEQLESGEFREDLYYRLNAFQIRVPPLRERGTDVIKLAKHFLASCGTAFRKDSLTLSAEAEEVLSAYRWPGNVRELRNVMERAAILCEGTEAGVDHLPAELRASLSVDGRNPSHSNGLLALDEMERRYIKQVLASTGNNLSEAARILGIARNTLKAKLAK